MTLPGTALLDQKDRPRHHSPERAAEKNYFFLTAFLTAAFGFAAAFVAVFVAVFAAGFFAFFFATIGM